MIEQKPVSIALLPADLQLIVRLVRDEYRAALAIQDMVYAVRLDRFLRRLGDDAPIKEIDDA